MDTKQLICTFSVAGKHYGVVVDNVQEVLANHQIADIPLAPPGVLGLMNIRGRIVPAINEPGLLCTNGMSNSTHSSAWANAAIVTTFGPREFGPGALAGVEFQRRLEERFFEALRDADVDTRRARAPRHARVAVRLRQ